MASLVADYGDSSGESEGESDSATITEASKSQEEKKEACGNFFAPNDDGSSDDSSADPDQDVDKQGQEVQEESSTPKLPNPFLQSKPKLSSPTLESGVSSVFVNPFEQAEQAKLGILEKHVRLTEAAPQKPASKQVCFKFKKGKCFLGEKCRFFHDKSNISVGSVGDRSGDTVPPETDSGPGFGRGDSSFRFPGHGGEGKGQGRGQFYHPVAQFSQGQPVDLRAVDDDNYMSAAKGKKRHGVSDTLVPPKKALMELGDMRKQERPWTMQKK